jgi:hypothetical protein
MTVRLGFIYRIFPVRELVLFKLRMCEEGGWVPPPFNNLPVFPTLSYNKWFVSVSERYEL